MWNGDRRRRGTRGRGDATRAAGRPVGAWLELVVGLALAVAPTTARAIGITGYTAAANNRFSGGFPTAPVANTNPAFVGLGSDWSGVGWSTATPTKGFGFITPQHYLVARHFGGATTIRLQAADGTLITGTQASVTATGYGFVFTGQTEGDLSVGRLTAPLPSSSAIARYGVLDLNASSTVNSSYVGQPLLVYGRGPNGTSSPRIGAATVNGTVLTGAESWVSTSYADVQLQSGDSGSPIFVPWTNPNGGRELTILGNNAGTDSSTTNVFNALANSTVMGVINGLTTADGFALRVVGNPARTWQGGSGSPAQQTHLSRATNWSGNVVPTDVYVRFDGDDTSFRSITVNAAANLRGLAFTATSGTLGFTLSGTSALSVGRGGIVNYDTARQVVTAPVSLGATQYWDVGPGGVTVADVATNGFLLEIAGSGTARIDGTVSGGGGLALSGHRLELAGSSTSTGTTWVHAGTLALSGTLTATEATVLGTTGTLAGTGRIDTGPISGAGLVSPGASPGILTVPSVDPSAGLDFAFEFTTLGAPAWADAGASGNDVLRLTAATPFLGTLTASNTIDVLLGFSTPLAVGALFQGGFFTDADADFSAAIDNATFAYWLADPGGAFTFNGVTYAPYTGPLTFTRSVVPITAAFAGGNEQGAVLQFVAVPEPATAALLLAAVPLVLGAVRRRRSSRAGPMVAAVAAGLVPMLAAGAAGPDADADAPMAKWEPALAAFEAQDRETPPVPGGIVFLGSSSIRRWDLAWSFPDLPVVNRGFGGSEIPDCTRAIDRIVVPHAPRVVVVYAGDNDIARGRTAAEVLDDFRGLVAAVRAGCPDATIVFLAIKPSPARRRCAETQREANRLIRAACAGLRAVEFVDVVTPMLGADGEPRGELFVDDGLHLAPAGYVLWTDRVLPHLRAAVAEPTAAR